MGSTTGIHSGETEPSKLSTSNQLSLTRHKFCALHDCSELTIAAEWLTLISAPLDTVGISITNQTASWIYVWYSSDGADIIVPPQTGYVLEHVCCEFVRVKAYKEPATAGIVSAFVW